MTTKTANIDQTKIIHQEIIDLLKVISSLEETMKILSNYGEQLKIQLDFNLTQQGM